MYDVIVIGGGHAGVEAACAAIRMGGRVALITMGQNNLGEMSCNPAIGGIGKGTIVREVDALGGVMGRAADPSATSFKILNRSKGPAVWGWRGQIDRKLYKQNIKQIIEDDYGQLEIIYAEVIEIIFAEGGQAESESEGDETKKRVSGVRLSDGKTLECKTCVIAVGTFLGAQMSIGFENTIGGRVGEGSSFPLLESLKSLGFELDRVKTGTPPRLYRHTVDLARLPIQPSDPEQKFFSMLSKEGAKKWDPCYIAKTNEKAHDVIKNNMHRSPVFTKVIDVRGPRYCPSIEDKIRRFGTRDGHTVFLEPEGFDSELLYPMGLSTSMPAEVQLEFFRSMEGLERVEFQQAGYVVQYCYINPTGLYHSLETKLVKNLFLAGQINGTTGYEEAAGQGIMAGINAMLAARQKDPLVLSRKEAFIGVMIDDLVSLGVGGEPYRIFTSRAENRLNIRADNAHYRLTPLGIEVGCVRQDLASKFKSALQDKDTATEFFTNHHIASAALSKIGVSFASFPKQISIYNAIKMGCTLDNLIRADETISDSLKGLSSDSVFTAATDIFYRPHIERQGLHVAHLDKAANYKLRVGFDYSAIGSLSAEVVEKLNRHQPSTLATAMRIPGVTVAATIAIMHHFSKKNKKEQDTTGQK